MFTIEAPLTTIFKDRGKERNERPSKLILPAADGQPTALKVDIRTRGKTRAERRICEFPPLRLDFDTAGRGTMFETENALKLVTHCQDGRAEYDQYVLQEYLVYRVYNLLTDLSFKVRLARVTYVDTDGKRDPVTRNGFLIEDVDAVAARNGWQALRVPAVPPQISDPPTLALVEVFMYLIGNPDWSVFSIEPGEETCCHNTVPIGAGAGPVFSVPYDFDIAGIVHTRYADRLFVPESRNMGIRTRPRAGVSRSVRVGRSSPGRFRTLQSEARRDLRAVSRAARAASRSPERDGGIPGRVLRRDQRSPEGQAGVYGQVCWVKPWATVGILVVLASPSFVARAQTTPPDSSPSRASRVAHALAVSTAPVIDGRLTEDVWRDAEPLSGFLQRELHEGEPVTERTEVRLLTDGEALYVGAWLYDREPAGIVPGEKVRDVLLTNSDYVGIILDTYLDRQNGFVFATTPAGIEYDGQVIKEGEGGGVTQTGQTRAQAGSSGGFNLNWDASWTVATSVDSLGWYAEFRIPFSTLRYGGGRDAETGGSTSCARIRRKSEEAFWSFVPRQFSLYRLSRAGTLKDIRVPSRRVATVTPYVLGGLQRNYLTQSDADRVSEWGVDAKYGLTPSLTLDLTYNTDFAQVEVDEQRTNLTRFPLFFPEKRPFFLENAGTFSAGTPQAVELFFSRRIGIDTLGNPVPIIGGGRVTGRVGGFTVGAMQIFTDEAGQRAAGDVVLHRAPDERALHAIARRRHRRAAHGH